MAAQFWEDNVEIKCTFCGGTNHSAEKCFKSIRQGKRKACADGASDNIQKERTFRKKNRCVSEYHIIAKCPKPPKDN